MMTEAGMVRLLDRLVREHPEPTRRERLQAVASRLGISASFLTKTIAGISLPGRTAPAALGYRRVVSYVKNRAA